jgi:hypothetical protein
MQSIIQHVSNENKEWVSRLEPKDIAKILDTLAIIPSIINIDKTNINSLNKSLSELPAMVGLQGEMKFETIIQQHMSIDYKLINTAKTGKCGDFVISYTSPKTNKKYSVLIDVKNYKTTVPTKEIEKFHRDIKLNSNINGGILLSLNSKIVGITKIIDFQELSSNNGIIPILFIKSNKPDVICELIMLIFHMIEIKDINRNEMLKKEELIYTINELNDDVQLITKCRDNLQLSKTLIEKSLNDILFNLMQCEYNLASKIKQINKSLMYDIQIILPEEPLKDVDNIKNDDLVELFNIFKNSIELGYESLIYSIYNLSWDSYVIDSPKKQWFLYKQDSLSYMYIKFAKKCMSVVFPTQSNEFIDIIKNNTEKGKSKSDGYHITINPENIDLILKLGNII